MSLLSQNIAKRRLEEIGDGVDILLTTCPFCVSNLKFGQELLGKDDDEGDKKNVQILDISEIIDQLM